MNERAKRAEEKRAADELVAAAKNILAQWRGDAPGSRLADAIERLDLAVKKSGKPEDWFAWMVEKRVRLQPVLAVSGKTIDFWAAGFTTTGSAGQNIVQTLSNGDTPMQALERLYRGEYVYANGKQIQPARKR